MERRETTIGTLFLVMLIGACVPSSEIQSGMPLPLEPASKVTTVSPAATQVVQSAAPEVPSPTASTPSPTPLMVPSQTWTQEDIPTRTPLSTETPGLEQIVFDPGEVSAVRAGQISIGKEFSIYALEGQVMRLIVRPGVGNPMLEVTDPEGNALTADDPRWQWPFWRGILPATGEYRLKIVPDISILPNEFELSVLIVPIGETS